MTEEKQLDQRRQEQDEIRDLGTVYRTRGLKALGRRGVQLPAAFFFSQPSSQDEWSPASLHNAVRDGAQ